MISMEKEETIKTTDGVEIDSTLPASNEVFADETSINEHTAESDVKENSELTPEVKTLEVQNEVFIHEMAKEEQEKGTPINPLSFIAENAPLFRYLANHLPLELRETWEKAALHDKEAILVIEEEFEKFRSEVERTLEEASHETMLKLTDAINRGDVTEASNIFETHLAGRERLSA
jgi:hypothetical protein